MLLQIYWTMAQLDGHGFSYKQSQIAMVIVANILFGRKWKLPSKDKNGDDDEESTFDADTPNNEKSKNYGE